MHRVVPEGVDDGLWLDLAHKDSVDGGEQRKLLFLPFRLEHHVHLQSRLRSLRDSFFGSQIRIKSEARQVPSYLKPLSVEHFLLELLYGLASADERLGASAIPAAVAGSDEICDPAAFQECRFLRVVAKHASVLDHLHETNAD